ncbi:MAG: 2-hydroxyglutaryl-CoA dehydratase [Candidatus Cloacimonadota bacterium]|nr:MAG: 2-hydroxyglutaryl-CoA dehydratase [Candidatus Cloacimonadota bacterium]
MFTAGIDIGSRTSKIVILDAETKKILYCNVRASGIDSALTAEEILTEGCEQLGANIDEIVVFSTGYGRKLVKRTGKAVSEISCHAKGIVHLFPDVGLIIDIGGQDSKAVSVNSDGKVKDFVMNDKCAAGTGRFLEVAATILETSVSELGSLDLTSEKSININSTCVVFAESEIIGLIAKGEKPGDIVRSVHDSIARRTANLASSFSKLEKIVFTGGVARNSGVARALSRAFKSEIIVPENPSVTGALGAALFAAEKVFGK